MNPANIITDLTGNNNILNVGIIGMGIGEKHALAYQNHPMCNIKTICDFDLSKVKKIKKRIKVQKTSDNYRSVVRDKNIDLISIASFDNYHAKQIIESIKNQKHVFAEKPLCLTRNEMKKIHHALELHPNIKLSSNLVLRTNPRFQMIKDQIRTGKLGDISYLEGDYYWGRKTKFNGWRSRMDFYSIILGGAIHIIDLITWMLDEMPIEVHTMGNKIATINTPLKFNSFAVLLLKFKSGIIAKITANGGCVHPHYHSMKVFGTKKTFVQNLESSIWIDSSENNMIPKKILEPYPAKELRGEVITSFIDHILDESIDPIVTKKEVFDVMSVCFASEEAMETGKTVSVNYFD